MKKKILWLFRTNLRNLEYYHNYRNLEEFRNNCHDFYLLMCLWYLENDLIDEVVVLRLKPKEPVSNIKFEIRGKSFTQMFLNNFNECLKLPKPTISFFRGGFPEYCSLTKPKHGFFENILTLYLGAGRRVFPQYGGRYKKILVESDEDLKHSLTIPFFKTASEKIFHPLHKELKYDLCWICNFTEINFKGQSYFLNEVSKSSFLKGLKIIHMGNRPEKGIEICKDLEISNINFLGHLHRNEVNSFLNESKLAIMTSDDNDGSPRVVTEIMMSGTPLLVRNKTRLLSFYKEGDSIIEFNDLEISNKLEEALVRYKSLRDKAISNMSNISLAHVCNLNFRLWET